MMIVDCLGRVFPVGHVWPDGSYNCPVCHAAVRPGAAGCPNPACFARVSPPYPVEKAREILAREEARASEEKAQQEAREFSARWRRETEEREAQQTREVTAEAQRRGACVSCALESARWGRPPKFTVHRKACPKGNRR